MLQASAVWAAPIIKGSKLTGNAGTETIEKQENPTAEEGKRKEEEKDGLRMRTLTSKGGSIGPVMVQMAAVSRSKPSEVMLLPKSNVADALPACVRRSCHAGQSSKLSQTVLMRFMCSSILTHVPSQSHFTV